MKFFFNKRLKTVPVSEATPASPDNVAAQDHTRDEIASVIALAIHMHINKMREYENGIITIQKILKPYSPWSSKIYGLRQHQTHTPALKPRVK